MNTFFLLTMLMLQPAGESQSLAERWSVSNVVRRPVVELVAEDNPLPLYWAGSPEVLPIPPGVPIVGSVSTYGEHIFGFWPRIDAQGNAVYGGTPIGHNLKLHLAKLREQLTRRDAKPAYFGDQVRANGFLCMDVEAFPIAWERVADNYKELAIKQIRERNPDAVHHMTDEQVEALTAAEWERRANEMFVRSAELVREIIPGTKVGYYGLTMERDVWLSEQPPESPKIAAWRELNEAALPTVRASDVLYPTIYHFYHDGGPDGADYVKLNVGEARRLADLANAEDGGERLVIPFAWGLYHNSNKERGFTGIDADDARADLFASHQAGADGLAFWDYHLHFGEDRVQSRRALWELYTNVYAEPYAELIEAELAD